MKTILVFIINLVFCYQTSAQNSVGNGGEVIASEFNFIGRTAVHFLKLKTRVDQDLIWINAVQSKIETTLLSSVPNQLILDGREVDAINYPTEGKILISRSRWEQIRLRTPSERTQIVLHEYLWIAGFDDSDYSISAHLVKLIADDLNTNSVSTEKYQLTLAQVYSELIIFSIDVQNLQFQNPKDYSMFCMSVGSLRSNFIIVDQLTRENIFWFPENARGEILNHLVFLNQFALFQAEKCISKDNIDILNTQNNVKRAAEIIKYLIRTTQFAESLLSSN